jgi:hypothetical protein
MIGCESFGDRGFIRVSGITPNGDALITREVEGQIPYLLRGGARTITSGGFTIDDTEAPFAVPVRYRVSISSIPANDRVVQRNMMLTPTFLRGVQGWAAGTGRTLTIDPDVTAASAAGVGHVTGVSGSGTAPVVPTLIGRLDTPVFQNGGYVLTPPTTGGTAIATNDWMLLVHQQLASIAIPTTPAGWTLVDDTTNQSLRQLIWKRKRTAGDSGYGVTATTGQQAIATLLWVRGATDEILRSAASTLTTGGGLAQLTTSTVTSLMPRMVLNFHSAATITAATPPSGANVPSPAVWQFTRSTGTNPRTLVASMFSSVQAGQTMPVTITYGAELAAGIAIAIVFQGAGDLVPRTIARAKAAQIPASGLPHLLTGRFRFVTNGLRLWSTVRDVGTWQQVKDAYPTWLDVRGVASTLPGDFLKVFVRIVNPVDNTDYVPPMQVFDAGEATVNQWIDFSVLFTTPVTIPTTAEIRILHGTRASEYAVEWFFDQFGITLAEHRLTRDTLYWFDGDSTVPADPQDRLLPGGQWETTATDSSMSWSGTPGNSVSVFTGPSNASTTTECWLLPELADQFMPCAPVLLSDPVNVSMAQWVGLLSIDALNYPSRQSVNQVISRGPAVVITQVRGWATGTLTVMTNTLAQRAQLLTVLQSGRVLLLRMPSTEFPENNWYLSIGDVTETRPIPMARVALRQWTLPFVRVERPTALIEASSGVTWQQLRDQGTWADVRASHTDWLDVILSTEDA